MRDQLLTQITLGVTSGDLKVGEKLPSRQEIAQRFSIHANTVSNVYQELREKGLIEFRQGSGFYVGEATSGDSDGEIDLDGLITRFFESAKSYGFTHRDVSAGLERRLKSKLPGSFLIIESDQALREILIHEISEMVDAEIFGVSLREFLNQPDLPLANLVALFDEKQNLDPVLKADETCLYLKSGSVPEAMKGETRPPRESLIAVVSGWQKFIVMAKTILVAAQIDGESIISRSTAGDEWKRGLESASLIICDSLTARQFPGDDRIRVFRVISTDSLIDLQDLALQTRI